ncbi:hypothetical protein ACS4RR_023735 [Rhizobium sp. Z1P35]
MLEYLRPLAPSPLAELTQGWIPRLRDKTFEKRKRKFANYVLTVLSILFEHGIEQELMSTNPVSKMKRGRKPTDAPEANRPWMDFERDAVAAHPTGPHGAASGAHDVLRPGCKTNRRDARAEDRDHGQALFSPS